jgi:hypothetical protein
VGAKYEKVLLESDELAGIEIPTLSLVFVNPVIENRVN